MEFIREHFELIVILLFVVSFVLLSIILSMNKYFAMYFLNKRFKIKSNYEVNAYDGQKDFTITIFNNNINEVRLSGFGFVYKDQNIDFYQNYLRDHNLPLDHKVVIHSRDYLTARIKVEQLKVIISDINKGSNDLSVIKVFVTDSLGLSTASKSKQVKDQIRKMLIHDHVELKLKQKEQARKRKEEESVLKKKQGLEKNIKRKEGWHRILLKIRGWVRPTHNKSKD
ncbi:MAG: hypothetical protein AB1414_17275 [bacterium]